jgi:sulfofructosephosphate aldolase
LVKLSNLLCIDTTADTGRPDPHLIARLARPSGGLAMVAVDQRESLRAMFEAARGVAATDDLLADFKAAAAEILSPHASAMLVDAPHGQRALAVLADAPACGCILALDAFDQEPGAPITRTDVDETIDVAAAAAAGVVGFKLLLMWNADGSNADECVDSASRFLDRAHAVGRLGVVEVMVRPPSPEPAEGWDRDAVLVAATRAMAALGPDLYKTEVPTLGAASDGRITAIAEELSAALSCPWVVLSSGVDPSRFPSAVEAACAGGASGFLAGRAIWRETLAADDYRPALAGEAVARLERLNEVVDRAARPWPVAAGLAPS